MTERLLDILQPVAPAAVLPECDHCGEEYNPRRFALGYRVCMPCGEQNAQQVRRQNAKACIVTHKSNIVYLGQGQQALANLADISRMRR